MRKRDCSMSGFSKKPALLLCGCAAWAVISLLTGSVCLLQSVTGLPCPSCGSTRAVSALFQGDINRAFFWHPLIPVTIVCLPVLAVFVFICRKRKKRPPIMNAAAIVILALYLAVYIARMVLYFPHTEPMTVLGSSFLSRIINSG